MGCLEKMYNSKMKDSNKKVVKEVQMVKEVHSSPENLEKLNSLEYLVRKLQTRIEQNVCRCPSTPGDNNQNNQARGKTIDQYTSIGTLSKLQESIAQ